MFTPSVHREQETTLHTDFISTDKLGGGERSQRRQVLRVGGGGGRDQVSSCRNDTTPDCFCHRFATVFFYYLFFRVPNLAWGPTSVPRVKRELPLMFRHPHHCFRAHCWIVDNWNHTTLICKVEQPHTQKLHQLSGSDALRSGENTTGHDQCQTPRRNKTN